MSVATKDELMAAVAGSALSSPSPAENFAGAGDSPLNRNDVPRAALAPDFLPPDTRWPELNELRDTHVRLRRSSGDAAHHVSALERKFEAEDEAKAEALKAGFAAGTAPDLGNITPDAERESLLKEARAISRAATQASLDHIDKVLRVFADRGFEFAEDLDAEDYALGQEIEAVKAKLTALVERHGGNERTREWMKRVRQTVCGGYPASAWLMRWADVPVARALSPQEFDSFIAAATRRAYADNMVSVLNPRRDEDGQSDTIRVPADSPLARGKAEPEPEAVEPAAVVEPVGDDHEEVELSDLAHEDLVDWLLATGMFDGEAEPTIADVLGVVEHDNPGLARRVLAADTEANGGEPRKGIADALTKIIEKESPDA